MSDLVEDFSKLDVTDLAYKLKRDLIVDKPDYNATIDPFLADKIISSDDLYKVFYLLNYDYLISCMPQTKCKINKIFVDEINSDTIDWWEVKRFEKWLDTICVENIVAKWLSTKDINIPYGLLHTALYSVADKEAVGAKILQKLVDNYKNKKSYYLIDIIEKVFVKINPKDVEQSCETLSKSTPAISACMLKRSDVPEKYIPKALKALGKLSGQREIGTKVDFKALENLGPRGRLNAMGQLLGTFDSYYKAMSYYKKDIDTYYYKHYKQRHDLYGKQKSMPFKELPNKEDLEKFLFPCSIKYNEEVTQLMSRYDELISIEKQQKGEK